MRGVKELNGLNGLNGAGWQEDFWQENEDRKIGDRKMGVQIDIPASSFNFYSPVPNFPVFACSLFRILENPGAATRRAGDRLRARGRRRGRT